MKKFTTSQRLRQIMKEKNLKQIDILNKAKPICEKWNIKIGSNDLSQYVTGKVEPSQKKLSVLAEVLEVDEVWLMGYDIPKEQIEYKEDNFKIISTTSNSEVEKELLLKCSMLDENNQLKMLEIVTMYLKEQYNYFKEDENNNVHPIEYYNTIEELINDNKNKETED